MAQTRWTLELLLLMVPDHSENRSQEQDPEYMSNISLQKLDEDRKRLAEKLNVFSKDITRYLISDTGNQSNVQLVGVSVT